MCEKNLVQKKISYVEQLRTKDIKEISYEDLYQHLILKYKKPGKLDGRVGFEFFDANETPEIKPHFDYEEYLEKVDGIRVSQIEHNFLDVANELFGSKSEDWAISTDCRKVVKKGHEHYKKHKISIHFVLTNKKVNWVKFGIFVRQNKKKFEAKGLFGVDESIYRKGKNKFRFPMTKKIDVHQIIEEGSLLIPINYKTKEDFHKHLVQVTEGCEILTLHVNMEKDKELFNNKEILENVIKKEEEEINNSIRSIIQSYTILTTRKRDISIFYDIKEFECGKIHKSNHNYLMFDTLTNTLSVKCHSERCNKFSKILYRPPDPTINFFMDYFDNIPIKKEETDNYNEVRKYFEIFFIFIRDSNTYYRENFDYILANQTYRRELKQINIRGYSKDLYYKEINNDDKSAVEDYDIEKKNFFKRYEMDVYKKSYLGIGFYPYGAEDTNHLLNEHNYNLFKGFNYLNALNSTQKLNIPDKKYNRLNFFIDHLRNHVCGLAKAKTEKEKDLAKHSFNYLMYFLANLIQQPSIVSDIIMIFFSKEHGTGKSGLTRFISHVIGEKYSYFGSFDKITEKHTNSHVGYLINVIEESDHATSRKYYSQMKDFSQRKRAVYNEKNKQECNVDVYVRYFMTTNESNGVYFDKNDRRNVVYEFDKLKDKKKVEELLEIFDDKYMFYLFGKYLEKIRIPYKSKNDWDQNRPLTKAYYEMQHADPIESFLKDLLTKEPEFDMRGYDSPIMEENDKVIFRKKTLYGFYKDHCTQSCSVKPKSVKDFFVELENNYSDCLGKMEKSRQYHDRKVCYEIFLRLLSEKLMPNREFINHYEEEDIP